MAKKSKKAKTVVNEEDVQQKLKEFEKKSAAERGLIDELRSQVEQSDTRCQELENAITAAKEKHQIEVSLLKAEKESAKDASSHEIESLKKEVLELTARCEGLTVLEDENTLIRDRMDKVMGELEKANEEHHQSEHRLQQDSMQLRLQLESTFRKALQEMDTEYREKAFAAMDADSRNALLANSKLSEELALQSVGIENMVSKYEELENKYKKLKTDWSLLSQQESLHAQRVSSLMQNKRDMDASAINMKEHSNYLKEENEKLLERVNELLKFEREKKDLDIKVKDQQQNLFKWKQRCKNLNRKLNNNLRCKRCREILTEAMTPLPQVSDLPEDGYDAMMAIWNSKFNESPSTSKLDSTQIAFDELMERDDDTNDAQILLNHTPLMEISRTFSSTDALPLVGPMGITKGNNAHFNNTMNSMNSTTNSRSRRPPLGDESKRKNMRKTKPRKGSSRNVSSSTDLFAAMDRL
eukprot:TRINITY_DN1690_c0_g1_i1.p1 TRINITY_DN1690_c0_g1~~TRINITY_DN1690_c0_g1_i1.p1  ORF type:complete len:469 (+),score=117.72 TRINITY_DN1690_c0_g1_i1:68-1474(+)